MTIASEEPPRRRFIAGADSIGSTEQKVAELQADISRGDATHEAERTRYARRGDRLWLIGYTLLFLDPSLVLVSVGLLVVGSVWFALWLIYLLFVTRLFPRVQTKQ